jgi:hypothetical protein
MAIRDDHAMFIRRSFAPDDADAVLRWASQSVRKTVFIASLTLDEEAAGVFLISGAFVAGSTLYQ